MGSRFVGTPRVGFSTSEHGRDYRVGYGLGVLDRGSLTFELGIDAQHRESPLRGAQATEPSAGARWAGSGGATARLRRAVGEPKEVGGDEPARGAVPNRPHDRLTREGRAGRAHAQAPSTAMA